MIDKPIIENVMLWRDVPDTEEEAKKTEAEFQQLCEQYHRLEIIMNDVRPEQLPRVSIKREEFDYKRAIQLAERLQREFMLGDVPSASLRQILEEEFYVKIFHVPFSGSAISTVSEKFGPAVLLNSKSKLWRRNFDLAHELFHLLTWSAFRMADIEGSKSSEYEDKLANAFASRLLLPTDVVKHRIEEAANEKGKVNFGALDEVAREFGVSLEALLWRFLYLYNKPAEDIEKYIVQAKNVRINRPDRRSDEPDKLPERYCSLAIRALKEGKLSLMQFAKYMDISYKAAQDYLTEDEDFTDEEISISIA